MSTDTAARWVGWFRLPGREWEPVCSHSDDLLCWRALGEHSERVAAPQSALCVVPAGVHPRDPIGTHPCIGKTRPAP